VPRGPRGCAWRRDLTLLTEEREDAAGSRNGAMAQPSIGKRPAVFLLLAA